MQMRLHNTNTVHVLPAEQETLCGALHPNGQVKLPLLITFFPILRRISLEFLQT